MNSRRTRTESWIDRSSYRRWKIISLLLVPFLLARISAFQLPKLRHVVRNVSNSPIHQISLSRRPFDSNIATVNLIEIGQESNTVSPECWEQLQQEVPTTMPDAVRTFFLSGDHAPLYVVASILTFVSWRCNLSTFEMVDVGVFAATVVFWSLQEHVLHEKVLHSMQDWVGKEIHQGHHDKPYYHVSIDPMPLVLGWMFTAHIILRLLLPLPLALTATIAYCGSGLFYEWAHFIVHTKVRFRSKFWKRVKENHLRHHVVSDEFWFAFSIPWVDDVFGTNPSVREVKKRLSETEA